MEVPMELLIAAAAATAVLIAWFTLHRLVDEPTPVRLEPLSTLSTPDRAERLAWLRSVRVSDAGVRLPTGPGRVGHQAAIELMARSTDPS